MARPTTTKRCRWARDPLDIVYHDDEWGVPVHDDRLLFEFLILEGAQAGLSWSTILTKPRAIAAPSPISIRAASPFGAPEKRRLMADAGIVRNRVKIDAAVDNARAFLAVQDEYGSFDDYIWRFVDDRPVQDRRQSFREVPAETGVSDALSATYDAGASASSGRRSVTRSCRRSGSSTTTRWTASVTARSLAWVALAADHRPAAHLVAVRPRSN